MSRLAEFIKNTRLSKGWTLRDVAARSANRISNPYLNQVENGKIKNISIRKLKIIADIFNIELTFLFKLLLDDDG